MQYDINTVVSWIHNIAIFYWRDGYHETPALLLLTICHSLWPRLHIFVSSVFSFIILSHFPFFFFLPHVTLLPLILPYLSSPQIISPFFMCPPRSLFCFPFLMLHFSLLPLSFLTSTSPVILLLSFPAFFYSSNCITISASPHPSYPSAPIRLYIGRVLYTKASHWIAELWQFFVVINMNYSDECILTPFIILDESLCEF